ncbi:hypothetical protein [Nocardioides montaniterrae]
MTDFDLSTFTSQLAEIETYLGYVRGNEAVETEAAQINARFSDDNDSKAVIFLSHCPDASCRRGNALRLAYPDDLEQQVFDALHAAWDTGPTWASGIAGYLGSITNQITEPYIPGMTSAISQLQTGVVQQLKALKDDDWAYIDGLYDAWDGDAGRKFQTLYDNYNERMNIWGQYAGSATLGFALATALIAGHQTAVGKYVESIRNGVRTMAQTWPDCKYGSIDAPVWLTTAETIGKDVLNIFNGVKIIKDVGELIDKIGSTVDIINTIAPEHQEVGFSAKTAEDLYTQLTGELYDHHLSPLRQSLDDLAAGKADWSINLSGDLDSETFASSGLRKAVDAMTRDQWFLPDPGTGNLNTQGVSLPSGR